MADAVTSRGPDSHGTFYSNKGQVAIGMAHRRLAIIDTSSNGYQPMNSYCGNYTIVFNGEIYNHQEIKARLESQHGITNWFGSSDTEVLLNAISIWGLKKTLDSIRGMFAFALWSHKTSELFLARDRLGEKPLYYGWQESSFIFASELSAIRTHPSCKRVIDRNALSLMMRHNSIPAPHSIYEGIKKLSPGSWIKISLNSRSPIPEKYWSANTVIESGIQNATLLSPEESVEHLHALLRDTVANEMVADVPIGSFLSGGIDSSTITALMQENSLNKVKTFTIGFDEAQFNEARYAADIARHLGTEHTQLCVTSKEALEVIPKLSSIYSEPFADSSQIPTYLVSELASRDVKVSLSGDGGDELFSGYNRYILANTAWGKIEYLPVNVRRILKTAFNLLGSQRLSRFARIINTLLWSSVEMAQPGEKVLKALSILDAKNAQDLYSRLVSDWLEPNELVIGSMQAEYVLNTEHLQPRTDNLIHMMMALDMQCYLPDDILTKVDRAAMAVSLETRVPFLDHLIVEFAWTLPTAFKLRGGAGKWPLREILKNYIPDRLLNRPKMGFGIPLANWLRSDLRDWAEDLISQEKMSQQGFFRVQIIRKIWNEHLKGEKNNANLLWNVLMFQSWLESQAR
tara:strand:- start:484 stop:2373 length:1890 start_codon:yes stop_codon:yes gene_type:complete